MSQPVIAAVILAILIPLWIRLRRDFVSGLCYAVVVLVAASHFLQIRTPGILPELTIHRLVFLSIAVAWVFQRDRDPIRSTPLAGWIMAWAGLAFVSLLGTEDSVAGTKRFIEFVFELFLFYFILATTLRTREDGLRVLRAAVFGLFLVALMAAFEKYTAINLVDRYLGLDPDAPVVRDVRATYRHRILLGTGMAMGWPLAMALMRLAPARRQRWYAWIAAAAMLAACYYARSRGPWMGAVLAGGLIFCFGSRTLRRPLFVVGSLAALVLIARPGVWENIFGLASATVDTDSFKGGTFQYRLELWNVAWEGIKDSPWRILFGNGPASGLNQAISWELSYRDTDYTIWSWDNDFAYALFQYGFLGLFVTLAVYGSVAWRLWRESRRTEGIQRDLFICLCASALVLFFMMSNVTVFARQLHYLFWTITAVAWATRSVPAALPTEETLADDTPRMDLPPGIEGSTLRHPV
ncbi:MAG: O-antigen ligase family protein [Verrucomicrobiae bacterium]|nr:O-antigen ligase family protein [Verrucomicrobiae bacterium]